MSTLDARNAIAEGVLSTKQHMERYTRGFDERSGVAQAPGLPNHVVWTLGHLAFTMNRVCEMIDGKAVSAEFFVPGALGTKQAFAIESVRYGSTPTGDAGGYPAIERALAAYNAACDRVADCVRGASDAQLLEEVPWGGGMTPLYLLALRMVFHNGMHTGQIADLRRAFKMPSVFAPAPQAPAR
jgi:hypothetical protein